MARFDSFHQTITLPKIRVAKPDSIKDAKRPIELPAPELVPSWISSHYGQPIFYTDFVTIQSDPVIGRVFLLGGVHGDELTSVSSVFNWMNTLSHNSASDFAWRIVPVVNPDGFFKVKSSRTNAHGVDLNRNLPTLNWDAQASKYWNE